MNELKWKKFKCINLLKDISQQNLKLQHIILHISKWQHLKLQNLKWQNVEKKCKITKTKTKNFEMTKFKMTQCEGKHLDHHIDFFVVKI